MNDLKDRKEKIKSLLPVKYFHEEAFDKNNRNPILADLKLVGLNDSNDLFKCGPILKKEEEVHLFRKYNYLKYRLFKLTSVNIDRLRENSVKNIEQLILKIQETRNILIKCNTRLIFKPATYLFDKESFNGEEFISNGYVHLMKAIEYFDYRRGFKFSTYCVWAVKSNLSRDRSKMFEKKISLYESLYENSQEKFEPVDHRDNTNIYREINTDYNKSFINEMFHDFKKRYPGLLDESVVGRTEMAEKRIKVLKKIYGLDGGKPLTLEEVSKTLGVSRSRVGQLREDTIEMLKKLNYAYDPLV
jgi:RNA polymerase primary sigma factor